MSRSDGPAARLRGALVGALSASAALAGHGLGGGGIPTGPSVVLLVLGSATIGAAAGAPARARLLPLTLFLVAGQAVGHLTLVAAGHQHGNGHAAAMVAAHALAALGCAALVLLAEHGYRRLASVGKRILVLVSGIGPSAAGEMVAPTRRRPAAVSRLSVTSPLSRRGPPLFAHS